MEETRMFGHRQTYTHKKRCNFCNKPVNNGYIVNDEHLRGFFCSAPHANLAYQDRVKTAESEGMKLEEEK